MLSLLCTLSFGAPSFEQAKAHVQAGELEAAEHLYHTLLSPPDASVYRALGTIHAYKEEPLCAQVAWIRAQNLEVFPEKIIEEHTRPPIIWVWFGVLLCYVGWLIFPKHLGKVIIVGLTIAMFAIFPHARYKGSVISDDVIVLHAPYAQGVSLASLSKGDTIQLIGREKDFWNISFGQTKGWVHEKFVISWDPYDTFGCSD